MNLPRKPATRVLLTFTMIGLLQCCCCVIPVRWRVRTMTEQPVVYHQETSLFRNAESASNGRHAGSPEPGSAAPGTNLAGSAWDSVFHELLALLDPSDAAR